MKKSIAKKWVAALRSGEYVQGRHQLVNHDDEFCCLGVLCNLAVDAGIGEWEEVSPGTWRFNCDDDLRGDTLPDAVQQWAGITSGSGRLDHPLGPSLMAINDKVGMSFSEIADIIEANWEVL